MFSFHKPKVYRSSTGCCICKAKSSSSRFTDSKKYEEDFLECFKLATPRQGEICNACVLLVKRWKKLPAGSDRNWRHVVDARAGPGMKSFTKFKSKNKKLGIEKAAEKIKKKKFEREYSPALSDKSDAPEDMEMNDIDFMSEDGPSKGSSQTGSPGASDNEDGGVQRNRRDRRKGISRRRDQLSQNFSGFIDLDYWKREEICCGIIFRGQNNDILIDQNYFKPCAGRLAMCKLKALGANPNNAVSPATPTSSIAPEPQTKSGVYSDSSSDSGYDDYSNQGSAMSPEAQASAAATRVAASTVQEDCKVADDVVAVREVNSPEEDNLDNGQVVDLMCHETIFCQEEVSEPSASTTHLIGCYQPQETAIVN